MVVNHKLIPPSKAVCDVHTFWLLFMPAFAKAQHVKSGCRQAGIVNHQIACAEQVDVVFEEVDEIVLQEDGLPFVAGRLAEPIQPQLLRMRSLLAASKLNVMLVDGLEKV